MLTGFLRSPICRVAACYLALTFAGIFAVPSLAMAAFIAPSPEPEAATIDQAALQALEEGVLSERLSALGLSTEEIAQRIAALSSDERQAVMADLERVQAGGDTLVGLAVLIILIIIIVKLLDKEIIIK